MGIGRAAVGALEITPSLLGQADHAVVDLADLRALLAHFSAACDARGSVGTVRGAVRAVGAVL